MKIALIHPLKHHAFYSLKGIMKYDSSAIGLFGFFYKNDIIDKILCLGSKKYFVNGYKKSDISKNVKCNKFVKISFLLYKIFPPFFEKIYMFIFQKWAISQIKKNNIECIHVLQDYCNTVIRYANKKNIKIVYEQITVWDETRDEILKRELEKNNIRVNFLLKKVFDKKVVKQKQNLKNAEMVICASKMTKESIVPFVNAPIYLIPYGCKALKKNIIDDKKDKNKPLHILYVGSFSMTKGVQYILQVAKELSDYNINFTLIGKPSDKFGKEMVKIAKKTSNLTYMESIPHSQINEIYKKNDIFIIQSICEGFGMVSLEALSLGLPCLVSQAACGVITDGYDGFINNSGDLEKIKQNILKFYENDELYNHMRRNAIDTSKKYTWEKYEDEISYAYRKQFGRK